MFTGDLGFRCFKLASSNIRAWEPNRDNLAATLQEQAEHLKTDRTEQDILFELLLKLGLDLTVPIEQKCIAGKAVHSIGGRRPPGLPGREDHRGRGGTAGAGHRRVAQGTGPGGRIPGRLPR